MNKKFKSADEFRVSLQERLKKMSMNEGVTLQETMKKVAFDRFLTRFFSNETSPWYLKGGYALELQLGSSRATRDVDLVLKKEVNVSDLKDIENGIIRDQLFKYIRYDCHDFFDYVVTSGGMSLDNTPYGGMRFHVECRIAGKRFVSFHIDISLNDISQEPYFEIVEGSDWLGFIGVPAGHFKLLAAEEIFSEKLHAYSLPRETKNSRVRDLVDMYVLVFEDRIEAAKLFRCMRKVFNRRDTHAIPEVLAVPPSDWDGTFKNILEQLGLRISMDEAFGVITNFLEENKILIN